MGHQRTSGVADESQRAIDDVLDEAESLLLAAALTALPPVEATIIRLHHESRLSSEDIGEGIGLNLQNVRTAWGRGLKRVSRLYRNHLGETAWRKLAARSSLSSDVVPGHALQPRWELRDYESR